MNRLQKIESDIKALGRAYKQEEKKKAVNSFKDKYDCEFTGSFSKMYKRYRGNFNDKLSAVAIHLPSSLFSILVKYFMSGQIYAYNYYTKESR